MKTNVYTQKYNITSIYCWALTLAAIAILQQPVNANTYYNKVNDTIVVNKSQTSKKYKIKIFPSATNEVLFFSASGQTGKVYQLFLFDIEGALVKQTQIKNKQTTLLVNLEKGYYTFEVFSDDERIENGTLMVR